MCSRLPVCLGVHEAKLGDNRDGVIVDWPKLFRRVLGGSCAWPTWSKNSGFHVKQSEVLQSFCPLSWRSQDCATQLPGLCFCSAAIRMGVVMAKQFRTGVDFAALQLCSFAALQLASSIERHENGRNPVESSQLLLGMVTMSHNNIHTVHGHSWPFMAMHS